MWCIITSIVLIALLIYLLLYWAGEDDKATQESLRKVSESTAKELERQANEQKMQMIGIDKDVLEKTKELFSEPFVHPLYKVIDGWIKNELGKVCVPPIEGEITPYELESRDITMIRDWPYTYIVQHNKLISPIWEWELTMEIDKEERPFELHPNKRKSHE